MQCANCAKTFTPKSKGFKRTALVSKKREQELVQEVLDCELTPATARKGHYLCINCDKLLGQATSGHGAKKALFASTKQESYIGRKRHAQPIAGPSVPKKQKLSRPNKTAKCTPGARYFTNGRYKQGLRFFLKKQACQRALVGILVKDIRQLVRRIIKDKALPLTAPVSFDAFKAMSMGHTISVFKREVPLLHDIIVAAFTAFSGRGDEVRLPENQHAALGFVLSIIASRASPLTSSLVQKMNAVQMWRAGCKRSLFQDFGRLGICCGEKAMLATLDKIQNTFDRELKQWKEEIQCYVFPGATPTSTPPSTPPSAAGLEEDRPLDADQWEDIEQTDVTASEHDADDEGLDTTIVYQDEDELDKTVCYGKDDVPAGFTLCWDNVGRQVKARHQTRNHGNRYETWALAYAVKNRIPTSHLDSTHVKPATSIPVDTFVVNSVEEKQIYERLVNMTARIVKDNVLVAQGATVQAHIEHHYSEQSRLKSEMFNIGVLDENPSTIAGVVNILDHLHQYVPTDGKQVHTLITWGDGLSCERHNDAQNSRANAETPRARLEGLEPAAQEFHKRMILMQDVMDHFYDGRSATDKGTLFQLRNALCQRSVTKVVSESFNYVSEFISFVTKAYILAFALDTLGLKDIDDEGDPISTDQLMAAATSIVDRVWCPVTMSDDVEEDKYCFCQENTEDEDIPMIECEGPGCGNGRWFHLECVGLTEDSVPEGSWFCSTTCRSAVKVRVAEAVSDDLVYEYSRRVTWAGLNDMVRRDAVRHNDGPMMLTYWKADLLNFLAYNHPKYFILGHRLIASVNGWLPDRLRSDLMWNRTVNFRGEKDSNDEADLVNEFLNREFKESLRGIGGKATAATLSRHGKLAGGFGKTIQALYGEMSGDYKEKLGKKKNPQKKEDIKFTVQLIQSNKLVTRQGGRNHKAYKSLHKNSVSKKKFNERVRVLNERLEKRRRVVVT